MEIKLLYILWLIFFVIACSNLVMDDEKGAAVFDIKIMQPLNLTKSSHANADTLTRVTIEIFQDSVFVTSEELNLMSGVFVAEIELPQGNDYYAFAEAFISKLNTPAFTGNSDLFEIMANQETVVSIPLMTTAIAVQILTPQDTIITSDTLSLNLIAIFPDSAVREVTHSASWSIAPGTAASIDQWGTVIPFPGRTGRELVNANYRGLSDSLVINVILINEN